MAWERFGYTGSRPTPRVSRCTRTSPSAAMRGATPACGRRGPNACTRCRTGRRQRGTAFRSPPASTVSRKAVVGGPKLRLLVRSRQH